VVSIDDCPARTVQGLFIKVANALSCTYYSDSSKVLEFARFREQST